MTKRKKACPDCCAYTITFSPENCTFIWDTLDPLNAEAKRLRKPKKSIEQFINEVLNTVRNNPA